MSQTAYYLALDYGTQSTRALVFDRCGNSIASASVPNENCKTGQGAKAAVQDGDYCYGQLVVACRKLFAEHGLSPEQIVAVTLSTQRACTLLMDNRGKAKSDVFMWSDRRMVEGMLSPMSWFYRLGFWVSGMTGRIEYLRRAAKVNLIRELSPGKVDSSDKIGLLSGYLLSRLGGTLQDSTASQVAYLPFDYRKHTFASPSSWRWQALGCRPSQMLPLIDAARHIGTITEGFAELTGLKPSTALVSAGADKACEAYANGAGESGVLSLSLGSAATVTLGSKRYFEVFRYAPAFPGLESGSFMPEVQLERGFWLLSWALDEFGASDKAEAKALGLSPEAYVMKAIADIPAGADGLMLCPYWAQGVIYPGPEASGIVAGFRPEHTRAHLYRALIEGVLMTLERGSRRLVAKAGMPIKVIRVSGGGSQSDLVMQLAADIFNCPTERLTVREGSGLGAAMCAAVAMGDYPNLASARQNMAKSAGRFEPEPANVARYLQLSKRHQRLYPAVKSLFKTR
ncbi:FGGY-family carbohydrate kinase [Shewanella litorisediminis]|uniref:FGGY-family carbohydrate kinase n=1 Tax=Shewanella litorisediminis TaxID=1173586 RepID=A0ABX7FZ05_9GAMM|nr:FGGY-family carbohydrate kinase [Shewanella litorisediminis]MCL2918767.1 FGGY-family carbohydrate kinase [Shewanella litorisediminis]QRH00264.1 FGGY-family carbohydrate kinase [Shewanella litorisediminis]